ncbi:transmembrane protease serine 11C-like [Puntigrus tetrazona]|uniref:transmembrane protease serine 11C-like n=1 Tax=Puntigrus tetrazona TaxID=1606681 RepID=UPI001C895D00|nr:transmembrane protease serine 11C-like [Puntigrus tetrazona]
MRRSLNQQRLGFVCSSVLSGINHIDHSDLPGTSSANRHKPHEIFRNVSKIIIHPKYNPINLDNDIALVQLSSSVNFTDYIRPVCLAAAGSTFAANTDSWVTGWGKLNFGDTTIPNLLQEVKIAVVSNSDCKSAYGSLITDNMLCAGPTKGGKGFCQGDGGGPLLIKSSQWIQSGIVSFGGGGCAVPKFPGVYSRVSQYQSWISSQISSDLPGFVEFKSSGFRSSTSFPMFSLLLFSFIIFSLSF